MVRTVERAQRPLAPEVHRALVAQHAALAPSPAREAHLAALASGAAAVVTGQQVGLFLGPLYTLYKAASAVALARAIGAVPVFWLQTEDHDLAEIAWCGVPGARLAVPADAGNRVSIAHLALPGEIEACLDELAAHLGDGGDAAAHLARLRRHYCTGAPWARAFAGVLAELFDGLVVIDPRDPALAACAAPIHARAVDDAERLAAALLARRDELERLGRAAPVHVRAGAPLSFVHPDGPEGPRARLEPCGGGAFAEVGGTRRFDRAALRKLDPRQFSTSALLRPILQDTLLPTAAYVGGPAEVAYFAQLAPLYAAFDLAMPLVVPRARFRIVDARTRAILARLDLAAHDLAADEPALLARVRRPDAPGAGVVERDLLAPFLAAHAQLAASLGARPAGDPVERALRRTRLSVERALGKLGGAIDRDALYRDAETVAAVRRLRERLAPDGAPQERVLGLPAFAARGGDRALVERVLAAIGSGPFTGDLQELA
ncbi:MAG: bacillithiol biosynthesis cysteine-adding enzyme BshC [Deltaproteobacteria bacterium]|nr:bacillithiol biosynthesis cysteine-adding enzyme BshC [Deltaproteobacteria bacterium]